MFMFLSIVGFSAYYIVVYYRSLILEAFAEGRNVILFQDRIFKRFSQQIFAKGVKTSMMIAKCLLFTGFLAFINVILLGVGLSWYFEGTNYPLPMPYRIPMLTISEPWIYAINLIHQIMSAFAAISYCSICGSICLNVAFYGFVWNNITINLTQNVQEIIQESSFDHFCDLIMYIQARYRRFLKIDLKLPNNH